MPSNNTYDAIVRTALWKAYGKKCFYCGKLIEFNSFHIDHVISRTMGIKKAREIYDLPDNFELNSYQNLVPTCIPCNLKKGAIKYQQHTIAHYFNIIKKKFQRLG